MIAQLFYGAWLFPLGYLVFKSGFILRILGVLLILHCPFWLMTFLQFFLFPDFNANIYQLSAWIFGGIGAEFMAYDLGVKEPKSA